MSKNLILVLIVLRLFSSSWTANVRPTRELEVLSQSKNFEANSSPSQPAANKRLGFAIVGLGDFAITAIMPNFANTTNCKITALVSGNRTKAEGFASMYGVDPNNIYNYSNFDAIKDNPDVDIVYIILPNSMHAEFTIRAAKAGKHVLCEKPMANSALECQAMIDACKLANVKLMIAYRVHFEPFNLDAVERIRNAELGNVRYINGDIGQIADLSESKYVWRLNKTMAGGGALVNIGIYLLNGARFLTGEEPIEVTAFESTDRSDPRFYSVDDRISFILRFPSGILAHFTSSYTGADINRYQVVGDKAWLELDPATPYSGHNSVLGTDEGRLQLKIEEGNQFAGELDHMADCVLNNKTPNTPGEEGLRDVKIMQAIYQSIELNKPISL